MTLLILTCSAIAVTAISAFLFNFGIDDDLKEAMNYETAMAKTAQAIKGNANE